MTYQECIDDFAGITSLRTPDGALYQLQRLNDFKTNLTTPTIIILFKEVETQKGVWSIEAVHCDITDNPSKYFNSFDTADYKFAALEINLELNDKNINEERRKELIDELESKWFDIRCALL